MASALALAALTAMVGTAAAEQTPPTAPHCPSLEIQGTVSGKAAPIFRAAAGRQTTLRLGAESCQVVSWRDRVITRTSGEVGPKIVGTTSRLVSRRFVYQLTVVAPTRPG